MATINHHEPPYTVGYFVGSLSTASINRALSKALIKLAPPELEFTEIAIGKLPLYNRDLDSDYPPAGRALKEAIASVDAVLFVTPEYNRAIPGALKNAIDWASRPWGDNSFSGKPSAVIGGSIGAIGTAVAQQNLRSHRHKHAGVPARLPDRVPRVRHARAHGSSAEVTAETSRQDRASRAAVRSGQTRAGRSTPSL